MHKETTHSGVWFVLGAALLWGTTGTAQAFAPAGFDPLVIGSLRLTVGGVVLLGAYLVHGRQRAVVLGQTLGSSCGQLGVPVRFESKHLGVPVGIGGREVRLVRAA